MPDEPLSATPAAVAPASAPVAEAAPHKMTVEEAHALLNAGGDTAPPPPTLSPFTEGDGPSALDEDNPMDALGGGELDALAAEPEPEAAAAVVEPAVAPTDEEPPAIAADADGRKRINILRKNPDGSFFFSARDRAIMNESAEAGISLAEAEKQLFGGPEVAAAANPPAETAKARTSADIVAEMDAIDAKLDEAAESYDTATQRKLSRDLRKLTLEHNAAVLREVQAEQSAQQQAAQAQQTHAKAESDSFDEVKAKYPEAWIPGSELNRAVWAEMARMEQVQPNFKADPEWPFTLTAKVAARKGTPQAVAAPAVPAKPPAPLRALPNPAPARRATPVPSPGAVSGATPTPDPITALSQELKDAKERRDGAAINAVIEKINKLGRSRAA